VHAELLSGFNLRPDSVSFANGQ
jgi:hypothetical protein